MDDFFFKRVMLECIKDPSWEHIALFTENILHGVHRLYSLYA
jgi:hypothetical protein